MEVTFSHSGAISNQRRGTNRRRINLRAGESGFTVIEVLIATIMFTVVSAGLLGLFAYSISNMQMSQQEMIARQKAREILEDVFAARNSGQIIWAQIYTVANGGIFTDGAQPMSVSGADGILGTADDGPALDALIYPGADGILSASDHITVTLSNFTRQIEVLDVTRLDSNNNPVVIPDVRQIRVTVNYWVPQFGNRSYAVSAFISEYR